MLLPVPGAPRRWHLPCRGGSAAIRQELLLHQLLCPGSPPKPLFVCCGSFRHPKALRRKYVFKCQAGFVAMFGRRSNMSLNVSTMWIKIVLLLSTGSKFCGDGAREPTPVCLHARTHAGQPSPASSLCLFYLCVPRLGRDAAKTSHSGHPSLCVSLRSAPQFLLKHPRRSGRGCPSSSPVRCVFSS